MKRKIVPRKLTNVRIRRRRGSGARTANQIRFDRMNDEEVVGYAKVGNRQATEHLITKYKNLVEGKAKSYFLVGADPEDVVQEGMIGLYKAIRDFRNDKLSRFRAFAELCVTRQIITAIKTATRQKHVPLNCYVSLHKRILDDDAEGALIDVIPDLRVVNPEQVVIDQQLSDYLNEEARRDLSDLESRVLHCYLEGLSYREMAEQLNCQTKSIDNALQRAKRKIGERMGDI
jgi:RNA polymerase sporulation-specific sigma factor